MRRLRLTFAALAVVLAVPLGLLLREVFETAERERTQVRQTVAQRLLDEMERELTAWLETEEARPYGHYRFVHLPEAADDPDALERSPLATPPTEDFLVGHFQIEPDGTVHSPLWPRDEASARARGFEPDAMARERLDDIRRIVEGFWSSAEVLERTLSKSAVPEPKAQAYADLYTQQAGTTVPIDPRSKKLLLEQESKKELPKAKQQVADAADNPYQSPSSILDRLNRGAQSRQGRFTKESQSPRSNVLDFADDASDDRLATAEEAVEQELAEADFELPTPSAVDIRYEPMVGRATADQDHLVLYRTVLIADRAYRQGVVLDRSALVDWLARRALEDTGATGVVRIAAVQSPADDAVPTAAPNGGSAFLHRFAEPFGSLGAVVAVPDLDDPRSGQLTTLAMLLTVAIIAAFLALYFMVGAAMHYAERRGNFVSAVSHELKTPLTAIRMHGEMLRDGVVSDDAGRQRYYQILTTEAERLTRLVNNVLELSRLEKKNHPMSPKAGDIGPVLGEVVDLLGPHVDKEGFQLRLEIHGDLPTVRFDHDALVQVLFNLIDNALKYAKDAEPREVILGCRPHDQGVELAVIDHGPGVAPRHLKKIFQPFYRGESELTRRAKGTGIGLALVDGLVRQMGGVVRGQNRDGGGFEVSIALPAAS